VTAFVLILVAIPRIKPIANLSGRGSVQVST
jgi:hypothetical protein